MPEMQQSNDRRRRRGAESRQAIIEAAIACIATRGLCTTTLDRVAERAQVSRGLVVFHFRSKSRMLLDVLNYLSTEYSTGWDAILALPGATPSETILRLLEYDVRFGSERPDYLSVWNAFWGEAKGSTLYREVILPRDERYGGDLRNVLDALIEEGEYDGVDPKAMETGIMAMLFGLWLNAHLNPTPDHYRHSMRVLNVYLASVFPRHFEHQPSASIERT
jgi:TetR/AcrR family transcriptional repressor of bet genes